VDVAGKTTVKTAGKLHSALSAQKKVLMQCIKLHERQFFFTRAGFDRTLQFEGLAFAGTRILLALMKSPLSKLPSMKLSPWDSPDELLGIVPMTVIRSIRPLLPKGLN